MRPDRTSALALAFERSPEPLAIVEGDAIHATNAAWRAQLGDATSLRACIDPADHSALAAALDEASRGRASLAARPAAGMAGGPRPTGPASAHGARAWTLWSAGDAGLCVRLDDPPRPLSLDEVITSKERALVRIFDSIDASLWTIRRDGTFALSVGNALSHYGLKPGQVVGASAFQLYPEGSRARLSAERTLAGERRYNELIEDDIHWVQFTEPLRGEGGGVEAMIGLGVNVQKNLQETRSARHLMEIVNALPVVVWAMAADGTCTLSAGQGLEHLGFTPGQLVGQNLFEFYRDNLDYQDRYRRALAGEIVTAEERIGERHWRNTLYPARNGVGEIVGLYSIAQDITERVDAEQRTRAQLATIEIQQRAIAELISPVIEVWRGVLVVPLIGTLTDDRAALLTERLLDRVVHRGAAFAILDLTGVDTLDSHHAAHLFRIMGSLDLLGCTCLFSGLRPAVASAMVSLDIQIPDGRTHPTLAEALRRCLRSPALRG